MVSRFPQGNGIKKREEGPMKAWRHHFGAIVLTAMLLAAVLTITGCEGSEPRNQVDDTVDELAGKKQVDRMKAMKEDLQQIQTQQADRFRQLDDVP
jgi:hypothetical protein